MGVRRAIFLAIGFYLMITLWGTMVTRKAEFYILAVMIGLVQGGIQALSRSYYARLIPRHRTAEYFGFYNMLGKFAAILGPLMVGIVGMLTDSSRLAILSISILFVAGGILLYFVNVEAGQKMVTELKE